MLHQREELQALRWRIRFLGYCGAAIFIVIAVGYWNHQLIHSKEYAERAEENRVREIPLIAQRGRIYDRYDRLIADNRPSYNIVLIRENSPHTPEQTVAILAGGVDISAQELLDRVNRRRKEPKFRPIILKEDVSIADMAFVRAQIGRAHV